MTKYLKDEQFYYDEYDRTTIEQCKNWQTNFVNNPTVPKNIKDKNTKRIVKKWLSVVGEVAGYFQKGDRYKDRKSAVERQIQSDKRKDETLESAIMPERVVCKHCGTRMELTQKDLDVYDESRVLFMFNCPNCGKGRAIYDNGQEWKYIPPNCPKCRTPYNTSDKKVGRKITTTFTCPKCKNKEEMVLDLDEKYIPPPIKQITAKDRQKYLMTDEEVARYSDTIYQMPEVTEMFKEQQEKEEHKELYDKVTKISRLKIAEVEKLLLDVAVKNDYSKFQLGKPDMGRYFIVDFSAEDIKANREEYDSKHDLLKACEKALKDTNWRVMSDGISYRAGYLTGRVRCYEKEEDLVALIRN